jgi:DNA primase
MARIAEEEIERLKRELSVERLAEARGVKLKQHGKDLLGLCPFHDDREPSLVITPTKNLWHCLGACQAGGSVIDWVMKAEGISFRHAVELLREDAPSLVAEARAKPNAQKGLVPRKGTTKKLEAPIDREAEDGVLLEQVLTFYQAALRDSPEALAYLEKRGLKSSELAAHFRLGFSNRTLGYRLPYSNRKEGAELRGRLEKLGLYRSSGHEHFAGSLVVPVFDESGEVVEMYGRKVTPRLRKGTPSHLYLPGPHRGVFNSAGVVASEEVILCESVIDAMTFWCAGFRNVTASYGTEGFTDDHRKAFFESGVKKVLIAYDRDEAGDKAAKKVSAELSERGIECFRVLFPKGMDANEYALKVGPAEQSLGLALRQAEWLAGTRHIATEAETVSEFPSELPSLAAPAAAAPKALPNEDADALPAAKASASKGSGDEVVLSLGDRRYRVRGLSKNTAPGVLRVNVFVSREGAGFHVDTLELYSARHRVHFIELASQELGLEARIVKKDLGEVLLRLELEQEQRLQSAVEVQTKTPKLSEAEREAALSLLRSPKLIERILEDFDRSGVVGERTAKLVGYLAATSRKLDRPLAVVIQSSSAAGKSSLMDAVLSLMPEEERVEYSAMTGQSLFYMGENDLRHKILAIVEEEGAERASYALKLLQSEGKLTIASTGKDPQTGRLVTQEYSVEGPVMIFLTTTAIDVDEELLNRCIVLTVDESREQTRAIHARQRGGETLEGLLEAAGRKDVRRLHQNAQRLLRPLLVANPFAKELTFLDHVTRTRRDHMKYLTLIRTVALLHQHQRPLKTVTHRGERLEYIEVTKSDIEIANELCGKVLTNMLDELPPKTRELLVKLDEYVAERAKESGIDAIDVRFTRRSLRERTGIGDTQLKVHLGRLVELEYVVLHRGDHSQRYVYAVETASYDARFQDRGRRRSGPVGTRVRPVLKSSPVVLAKPVGANGKARRGNGAGPGVVAAPVN